MARQLSAQRYREETDWVPGTCTWCRGGLPGSRQTFCSDDCVESFKLHNDPVVVRRHVMERDQGVCARCGLDTLDLSRKLAQARELIFTQKIHPGSESWMDMEVEILEICCQAGLDTKITSLTSILYATYHVWEADHIVPVIEGGANGPENIQTLCLPCHRKKTASWHRHGRRAS